MVLSVLKHTRLNELIHWETATQNLSMDLSTQWPVFEVSRYKKGLPLYDLVYWEYVDKNSYEVKSCPESQYNMWDCCFIQLFSYGKLPYDYDDQKATEKKRNISRASYEEILEKFWARYHIDLRTTLPRAWPPYPYLTEEQMQQIADVHPSAPPLKRHQ